MKGRTPEKDLIAHLQALCIRLRDTERVTVRPSGFSMRAVAEAQGHACVAELNSFLTLTATLSQKAGLPDLYSLLPTANPSDDLPVPFPEDLPAIACYRPRTKDWATFQPLVAEHLRNEFIRIAENEWIPWLECSDRDDSPEQAAPFTAPSGWLTVTQAAEMAKCSPSSITRACDGDLLTHSGKGRNRRICPKALDAYAKGMKVGRFDPFDID
ncbi:MAG: helix-turn-helix domain-containing protein [FCB group bacterium]|jgi:hypothetical protein|nr:helix-turn-helix domain-containing protein [FCB group bacterium]